jgi:regulator of RNase E activity RraA
MHDRVSAETLNALLLLDSCGVANVVETFHVVEFGTPVEVAGLQGRPGNLVHGDQNGLVRIPLEIAKGIPDIAIDRREREKQIIAYSRSAEFSVAGLCALLEQGGRG